MEIQKKIFLCTVGVVAALTAVSFLLPADPVSDSAELRIGAGDDVSGYIMEQALQKSENSSFVAESNSTQGYAFKDC